MFSRFAIIVVLASNLTLGLSAAGEISSPGRVSTIAVPNSGEPADAKITADGTIHLLYNLADIPYYVKSTDKGATFSAPIPVVDKDARKPGLVFSGWAMAVSDGGTVHVAMMTNNWKVKLSGVPEGMVFASLFPPKRTFTPVRSLNGRPSEGFSLAADEKGNVAATWLADKMYVNYSRDGGRTFTANAEIDPAFDPCNCCTTHAAYAPNGDLAVLYREETNNDRDIYLVLIKKDGSKKRTRISQTPWKVNGCPMTYYSISSARNGYVAAWPTKGDIYFARLDKDGNLLPPGEIKTPGRSGMRTGIVALSANDGMTLITWRQQDEIAWQIYDEHGIAQGPPRSVKSAGKGAAAVVDSIGSFLIFN